MEQKMSSRPRQTTSLARVVQDAVAPIADNLTQLTADVKSLSTQMQDLRLNTPHRQDVYSRDVMDEKLKGMNDELKDIRGAIADMKGFVWKALAGGAAFITIIVYAYQHINIH